MQNWNWETRKPFLRMFPTMQQASGEQKKKDLSCRKIIKVYLGGQSHSSGAEMLVLYVGEPTSISSAIWFLSTYPSLAVSPDHLWVWLCPLQTWSHQRNCLSYRALDGLETGLLPVAFPRMCWGKLSPVCLFVCFEDIGRN